MDTGHNSQSRAAEPEIRAGERFAFGENWLAFLESVDQQAIADARAGLMRLLPEPTLHGKRLLDAGCGSGLSSLAAVLEGAAVHAFDFDEASVVCSRMIREKYGPDDSDWAIEQGSVLDRDYLAALGLFDVVYSWGVLHHTGAMWQALANVCANVRPGGYLFIALYNDQGWISRYWHWVKRMFNAGKLGRWSMIVVHVPYLLAAPLLLRALSGRLRPRRGMSLWRDMLDWLGGLPFEVARPAAIVEFYGARGFELVEIDTVGRRLGCNEFVFRRSPVSQG